MKKRLLCLFLGTMLVLSSFIMTSCTDEEVDPTTITDNTRNPVSLSFYIITDDSTTDLGISQMQEAFNEYTESNFTTHVEFKMFKAGEYEAKLKEAMSKAKKPDTVQKTEYETIDGMTKVKYPEVSDNQVDIVLITSRELLNTIGITKFAQKDMDNALKNSYPSLTSYYNSNLINLSRINKLTYAIPNNHIMGEYTYMIIDRAAAELVFSNSVNETVDFNKNAMLGNQNNVFGTYSDFLELAKRIDKYNQDNIKQIPVLASSFEYPNVTYYSTQPDGKSILSVDASNGAAKNLLENNSYIEYLKFMAEANGNDWIADTDNGFYNQDNQNGYVMKVVKGDYALRNQYNSDDYIVKVIGNPVMTVDDVFSSMFAISSTTTDFSRSMEIINALQTNEQLHNILQYGKKGEQYDISSSNIVSLKYTAENAYSMNPNYTGNFFLTYPCEDIDMLKPARSENSVSSPFVTYGKLQNSDCISSMIPSDWLSSLNKYENGNTNVLFNKTPWEYKYYVDESGEETTASAEGSIEKTAKTGDFAKYADYSGLSDYDKISQLLDYVNGTLFADFFTDIGNAGSATEIDNLITHYKGIYNSNTECNKAHTIINTFMGAI